MHSIQSTDQALRDLELWIGRHPKTAKKILKLLREVTKTPFVGTGKPEPLQHTLSGLWSRRITQEDRLVYKVEDNQIIIV